MGKSQPHIRFFIIQDLDYYGRLFKSIKISLKTGGVKLAMSIFQIISLFWILVGIIFFIFGDDISNGFFGLLFVGDPVPITIMDSSVNFRKKK